MDQIKIAGKMYNVNCSIGRMEKATSVMKEGDENNTSNLIDAIWIYLERKFIFKPFLFKFRLKDKISIPEIVKVDKDLSSFMQVEDREGGNLK